jgi:polar amino acid transport system substrate-binding protein
MTRRALVSGLALVFILALALVPAMGQGQSLTLATLDWPPYTGASLKDSGASSAIATAAFKAMGYNLKLEFLPWERAVTLAKNDSRYAGYFPEYYAEDNAKDFRYSEPMGIGPLGFVERRDAPVKWTSLDDLKGRSIGVVSGYINTTEFDAMAESGKLKTDVAPDDATNLKKVAGRRVSLAVIDPNVMDYLLANDPKLAGLKDLLQFNAKTLELKKLYICFKKGPEGEKLAQVFAEGLKKIDVEKVMRDYLAALGK